MMYKHVCFAVFMGLSLALAGCSALPASQKPTFKTIRIKNEKINLASGVSVIDGRKMKCEQSVQSMNPLPKGGYEATIKTLCAPL
jgi:starvation-inducible outer membrane lipoprotein